MLVSRSDFHVMAAGMIAIGLILIVTLIGINDEITSPIVHLVGVISAGISIGTGLTFFLFMAIQKKARDEYQRNSQPEGG